MQQGAAVGETRGGANAVADAEHRVPAVDLRHRGAGEQALVGEQVEAVRRDLEDGEQQAQPEGDAKQPERARVAGPEQDPAQRLAVDRDEADDC